MSAIQEIIYQRCLSVLLLMNAIFSHSPDITVNPIMYWALNKVPLEEPDRSVGPATMDGHASPGMTSWKPHM